MRWIRALFCVIACAVVFVLSTSLTIRFLLTDKSTIPCPDMTGLDYGDAKRTASDAGLSALAIKYEVRKDVPYSRVISQKPDAGTPVRVGRIVSVILSDGPRLTTIPHFVGLSVEEAQSELQARGMPLKQIIYVPSDGIGRVLAQAPPTGENILDEEGMVLIVGGRERRFFMMPEISAGDLASIIQELEKKQIKYSFAPAELPETGRGIAQKNRILPRTVFGEDSIIELPANGHGG
jgi:beta-lactam-binding protein with PASTA domain